MNTGGVRAGFVARVPGVDGSLDKEEGLRQLRSIHEAEIKRLGFTWENFWRAEQVHGGEIAVVPDGGAARIMAGVDGLVTSTPGIALGIYVADCGLIWLHDQRTGALGLLHSGKKGTEANILGRALGVMAREFGTDPANVTGVLGPCIRPPHYEIDFAATIRQQAAEAGIGRFDDCGLCTGSDPGSYYSYRMEKGHTGRMLGIIGSRAKE